MIVKIILAADLNVLALSEMIRVGNPRLDVKRLKHDGAVIASVQAKLSLP